MSRNVFVLFALMLVLNFGCANPAANKPNAGVTNAAPETNAAKPAGAEMLLITPDNSKVELSGVMRSISAPAGFAALVSGAAFVTPAFGLLAAGFAQPKFKTSIRAKSTKTLRDISSDPF